jgi:hypothetical protein
MGLAMKFVMLAMVQLLVVLSLEIVLQSSFAQNMSEVTGNKNYSFTQYENPDIGIRLSHPPDWGKIVELDEGCHKQPSCVLDLDGTNTNYTFGFSLQKFSKDSCNCMSLMDHVRNDFNSQVTSLNGFSFINDNQTTIGKNYPGWQYEYSFLHNGVEERGINVFATFNDTYYSIGVTYPEESRAKLLPEFKKVIDSIEFLPVQDQINKIPSFMNMSEVEGSRYNTASKNNTSGLQILSHNSFTDSEGYMHVVGEIKNNSPSPETYVKIIGTFYDTNNQVVGAQFTYANPPSLGAGDKAPFEIVLTSASVPTSLIDHYILQASH